MSNESADDDGSDPAPELERITRNQRRYRRVGDPFTVPVEDSFVQEHEFVTAACVHRRHRECEPDCHFCGRGCLCVCHRWRIAVEDA